MTTFKDRENAAEAKYARDKEMSFKVNARRNKLLGLWVAEKLGKSGTDAESYAKEVVVADFDAPGDEDVFKKVFTDLEAAGAGISEHRVRRKMEELLETASEQIEQE